MADPRIRPMTRADWPSVGAVYAAGIATGQATFETEVPSWESWDAAHTAAHRIVLTDATGTLLGWAACSSVSDRCVYAGVLELSVYVAPDAQGRGVGSALLDAVIGSTETEGVWTLQAGIFAENAASLALHARHGFRVVGTRERLGQRDGRWRDVVLLERRSSTVGC